MFPLFVSCTDNTGCFLVLFTHFPSLVTSYITISQYQNQKINIGIIDEGYSDFTSYTCTCMCRYVCLVMQFYYMCNFVCNHHHNQDVIMYHHFKALSCFLVVVTPIPLSLSLILSNHHSLTLKLLFHKCYINGIMHPSKTGFQNSV